MSESTADIVILGGGMVGLSLAHQLNERHPDLSIAVIDKEPELGRHSSGRNMRLHAGIYYPPGTLKAQVCVEGARPTARLVRGGGLPVLACGKVIAPQSEELDGQLELLLDRGRANGAEVRLIDQQEFQSVFPMAEHPQAERSGAQGTCVVKPKLVLQRRATPKERGVQFLLGAVVDAVKPEGRGSISSNHTAPAHSLRPSVQQHRTASGQSRSDFGIGQDYTVAL